MNYVSTQDGHKYEAEPPVPRPTAFSRRSRRARSSPIEATNISNVSNRRTRSSSPGPLEGRTQDRRSRSASPYHTMKKKLRERLGLQRGSSVVKESQNRDEPDFVPASDYDPYAKYDTTSPTVTNNKSYSAYSTHTASPTTSNAYPKYNASPRAITKYMDYNNNTSQTKTSSTTTTRNTYSQYTSSAKVPYSDTNPFVHYKDNWGH